MNFEDGNVFFIKTNKTFITHPVACEFSSCNSHKHKSYDDLKILSKKLTFFSGSGKRVVDLALGSELGVMSSLAQVMWEPGSGSDLLFFPIGSTQGGG